MSEIAGIVTLKIVKEEKIKELLQLMKKIN